MSKNFEVSSSQISTNGKAAADFAKQQGVDALYISSFDPFISEYVPTQECHRYYVSGFTGSVAEVLVLANGQTRLYVDGRYHEQADKEVNLNDITVVKVGSNTTLSKQLLADIEELELKTIGFEGDRTPLQYVKMFEKVATVKGFYQEELHSVIPFESFKTDRAIKYISSEFRGLDTDKKIARMNLTDGEAYFVTAIDEVAWITNCRGYHLPHLSSFMGRALITREKVFVFVEPEINVDASVENNSAVEFVKVKSIDLETQLKKYSGIKKLNYAPTINAKDFNTIESVFGGALELNKNGLIPYMSIKEDGEIKELERSFVRSSKAVHATLSWIKDEVEQGNTVTELDFYNKTEENYRAQGAVELSFNSIAAVGPNGSIIHFGDSSANVKIKKDDLCLLDSGGYYEGGFATDKTRGFLGSRSGKADPKAVEIYTLVLKGLINCESAVFPEGTKGNVLDGLARTPLYKKGYDFAHGTGHGVGVHVHEGGLRISSMSDLPMKAGQVTSVEPGIYIPGFGGVRLENVCVVEKHPLYEGFLYLRPLSFIGYDWSLIDESLLNEEEKAYLNEYEKKCSELGTSFKS